MTVMRSAIANTSSRRWETYSMVMPVVAQVPQDREQPLGLALVERGVGLVEDEQAGAARRGRG